MLRAFGREKLLPAVTRKTVKDVLGFYPMVAIDCTTKSVFVERLEKATTRIAGELFRAHSFELACTQNDIDHRLTKPRHP